MTARHIQLLNVTHSLIRKSNCSDYGIKRTSLIRPLIDGKSPDKISSSLKAEWRYKVARKYIHSLTSYVFFQKFGWGYELKGQY